MATQARTNERLGINELDKIQRCIYACIAKLPHDKQLGRRQAALQQHISSLCTKQHTSALRISFSKLARPCIVLLLRHLPRTARLCMRLVIARLCMRLVIARLCMRLVIARFIHSVIELSRALS